MFLPTSYKLLGTPPTVAARNISGMAYNANSGTPTHEGIWRIKIMTGVDGEAPLMAEVMEVRDFNERRKAPVKASTVFTSLIAGLNITLGATVVNGDEFEIVYSSLIPDTV